MTLALDPPCAAASPARSAPTRCRRHRTRPCCSQIPARYAEGGRVDLRVTGSGGGMRKRHRLHAADRAAVPMTLQRRAAARSRAAAPLDVEVTISVRSTRHRSRRSAGRALDLADAPLPPGVTRAVLPDAHAGRAHPAGADDLAHACGSCTDGDARRRPRSPIAATAPRLPADLAGERPFVSRTLDLHLSRRAAVGVRRERRQLHAHRRTTRSASPCRATTGRRSPGWKASPGSARST